MTGELSTDFPGTNERVGERNGNHERRIAIFCKGTFGLVYRNGANRFDVPTKCPSADRRRDCDVRARGSHRVAHSFPRSYVDRHQRMRMGAARGRTGWQIRPGDVVWFEAREKHWHGATATTAMTPIAIAEALMERLSIGWNRSAMNSIERG